jgi:hypothetical protein
VEPQVSQLPKRRGRPRKNDGPDLPYDELDHLLVHGEVVEPEGGDKEGGQILPVRYPSYRELGRRYGVAHALIARYSSEHNCLARRKQFQADVRQRADEKLAELRANIISLTEADIQRTIDLFLAQFEQALQEGRVRCDNPADYNLMVRLRAFVMGEAESRKEVIEGMPTLVEIQARYEASRHRWENSTPAMRGEVPLVEQVSPPQSVPIDDDDDNIIDAEWEEVPGHHDEDIED